MNRSSSRRLAPLIAVAMLAGCFVDIDVPLDAKITCGSDDECPEPLVCVEDLSVCVHTDSPCATKDGATVANGTECGEGVICIDGACAIPFCGDGVVDVVGGEQCDPAFDGACREDCVIAFCGDAVVDIGESCDGTADCAGCFLECAIDTANCDFNAANGCECAPSTLFAPPSTNFFWTATTVQEVLYTTLLQTDTSRYEVWRVPLDGAAPIQIARDLVQASVTSFDGLVYVSLTDSEHTSTIARIDGTALVPLYAQTNLVLGLVAADEENIYVAADGIYVGDRETGAVRGQLTPVCGDSWLLQACGADVLCYEDDTFVLWAIGGETGETRALDTGPNIRAGCSPDGKPIWHDFINVYTEGVDHARLPVAELPPGPTDFSYPGEKVVFLGGDPVVTLFSQGAPAAYLVRRTTRATEAIGSGYAMSAGATSFAVFDVVDAAIKVIGPSSRSDAPSFVETPR